MRVAYVEDIPTNLALVERVALLGKHQVVSYTEGEIAIEELLHGTFDLILMDVELAGDITGLDVVRHLRANGIKTPIVAVTAYAMQGDLEKCLTAGCDSYLSKPMPIPALIAVLEKYAQLTSARAAQEPSKPASPAAVASPAATSQTPVPASSTPGPGPDRMVEPSNDGARSAATAASPVPGAEPPKETTPPASPPSPSQSETIRVTGPAVGKSEEPSPFSRAP
ncbi:MAG TPA: response regulator [Aggregatilineales bacterium]|nr:response regulator [Aggregatilineales bacterium]